MPAQAIPRVPTCDGGGEALLWALALRALVDRVRAGRQRAVEPTRALVAEDHQAAPLDPEDVADDVAVLGRRPTARARDAGDGEAAELPTAGHVPADVVLALLLRHPLHMPGGGEQRENYIRRH